MKATPEDVAKVRRTLQALGAGVRASMKATPEDVAKAALRRRRRHSVLRLNEGHARRRGEVGRGVGVKVDTGLPQ